MDIGCIPGRHYCAVNYKSQQLYVASRDSCTSVYATSPYRAKSPTESFHPKLEYGAPETFHEIIMCRL